MSRPTSEQLESLIRFERATTLGKKASVPIVSNHRSFFDFFSIVLGMGQSILREMRSNVGDRVAPGATRQ